MSRKNRGFRSGKMRELAKKHYNEFIQEFNQKKKIKELEKSQEQKGFLESIEEIFSYTF